jgi:SAM-dependent methyltransferase
MSEWFANEEFWIATYPQMFPEERFEAAEAETDKILSLVGNPGPAVLDLCCGPGRFAIAFARRGYLVTGVDRSRFLLEKARQRAQATGIRVEWVEADMRDFTREAAFDLALSMFTSFGYFAHESENAQVLINLHRSLKPGGFCLIDVVGKERLAQTFRASDVNDHNGALIVQRRRIFDDWSKIHNEWIWIEDGRMRSFEFSHTIYSGRELKEMLLQAGFRSVQLYGSLDGDE